MRYSFAYHESSGVLEVVVEGRASPEGDAGLVQAILAHPKFYRGLPVLLDQTRLEIQHLSQGELRATAEYCAQIADTLGEGPCAILVGSQAAFGIARMWEAFVDERVGFRTRVFRSRAEAWAWLVGSGGDAA